MQTLRLPIGKHRMRISTNQIVRLEGSCNYTVIFLSNGKNVMVASTLLNYEQMLEFPFVRIHKSNIINLEYANMNKDAYSFTLKDGTEIPIARRRRKEIINLLKDRF